MTPLGSEELRQKLQAEVDAGNPVRLSDGSIATPEQLGEMYGVEITRPPADAQVAGAVSSVPGQPVSGYSPPYPVMHHSAYTFVAQPAPPRGLSISSMVLGLVSIVFGFTFVVPLVSLILGIVGLRREPAGRGMALTGVIISGLILLGWVAIIGLFVALGLAGTAATVGSAAV